MAGIYIHIPYCRKACTYCNFHFSTSLRTQAQLVAAIKTELVNRREYLNTEPITTIYFGGGTPSTLSSDTIADIISTIEEHYPIAQHPEITLEANPDDLTTGYLEALSQTRINRLSIGVQSFRETDLVFMNRSHNATQAIACIQQAQKAGFTNISIDLIYGTPGLNDNDWRANLTQLKALHIPHFSAYSLTVEAKTALHHQVTHQKVPMPDAATAARQLQILIDFAADNGYDHYEISNYALPGKYAVHNTNYWRGVPYLGVGPSAHSYNKDTRSWNIANNALYIKAVESGVSAMETETLSKNDKINEYLLTTLRTMWGCDLEHLAALGSNEVLQGILACAEPYVHRGLLQRTKNALRLTNAGKFYADGIAADLFVD